MRIRGSLEGHHGHLRAPYVSKDEPKLKENPPLVTVVIPCYNQAHFLGEAIESVLCQTYRHFEVVVVDDGSTDETSEVASRYGEEGVRLIRQENRGLSGARNTGLRHSGGEFLVFLDADDRLLPRALEAGLGCYEAHPECALVAGHSKLIRADGTFLRELKHEPPDQDPYVAMLEKCHIAPPASGMYRRSAFEAVGGFRSGVDASADYDLYLRIARQLPICRYDEAVAEYSMHGENMIRNSGLMLSSAITVLRSQRRYVEGDRRREAALKTGIRYEQSHWGDPLAEWVRQQMGEGRWREILGGAYLLARYHPRGLNLLIGRKRLLERRLEARENEVRAKEWQVKKVRKELNEQRRELHTRTQQLRRLRQRIRRLEEARLELLRKLQVAERTGSGARWTLLERMRRWGGQRRKR
jgi:glycosyltransferase involved in cell wall biosynthesis